MSIFEACEECTPALNKLSSKFHPQTFNPRVVCGTESQKLLSAIWYAGLHSTSRSTHESQINEAQ